MNPLSFVRDNILRLAPYSTARDEFKGGAINTWLDANESPYATGLNRYPDPRHLELKRRIGALKGVAPESVFIGGAGSDEAIDLVYRIFCRPGIDNVVAMAPTYGVYSVAAAINDVEYREVMPDDGFAFPFDKALAAADANTKVIWVCSPNNPTGRAENLDDISRLARSFDGIVAVDEAYVDFSPRGSMLPRLAEHPNLIVLQTFSKAWGMASLRVGMAFADPRIASIMAQVKYPYNISGPVQKILMRQLGRDISGEVAEIVAQRELLAGRLGGMGCVREVFPSDANFLLVRFDDPDAVYDYLSRCGVLVRNRNRVTLCGGMLRITVGTPAENERVIAALSGYDRGDRPSRVLSDRVAVVERRTAETDIYISLDLDGNPADSHIDTGLKFFDHMLMQFPHHGGFALTAVCRGDLEVDEHHTIEDVAIALGEAFRMALGDKRGIERYGFTLPMDESSASVLLDLGGRVEVRWDVELARERVGDTPTEMYPHFFKSFATALGANLHITARGENTHHVVEAVFKAVARALRMAIRRDGNLLASSKGII